MAKLGFVGLGAMGSRVVQRLIRAGHTVTGYNRTRARAEPLLQAGMAWAGSPAEAAVTSEIVFTMVTDTAALTAVLDGPEGVLARLEAGKVLVDMSTVSPSASREIAARVAAKGARMLDAPVSGSPLTVEQGNAAILIGGEREVFQRVEPVLRDISPKVTYLGGNGAALILKLASNLNLAAQMLAFAEGVLLAEKNGIAAETAVEVLLNTAAGSPMLKYRGPLMLDLPETAWFSIQMMQKDLLLALEVGRANGTPLPTAALVNEYLTAGRGQGLAEEDFAALYSVLARLAGGA